MNKAFKENPVSKIVRQINDRITSLQATLAAKQSPGNEEGGD